MYILRRLFSSLPEQTLTFFMWFLTSVHRLHFFQHLWLVIPAVVFLQFCSFEYERGFKDCAFEAPKSLLCWTPALLAPSTNTDPSTFLYTHIKPTPVTSDPHQLPVLNTKSEMFCGTLCLVTTQIYCLASQDTQEPPVFITIQTSLMQAWRNTLQCLDSASANAQTVNRVARGCIQLQRCCQTNCTHVENSEH